MLALAGLAAIVFSIFAFNENTPLPSVYALIPVLGVILLLLYADKDTFVAKLFGTKLFVGIGLISYSAYLWHQPLFAFGRIQFEAASSEVLMLLLAAVSFVLAAFSWKFIEAPFRNKNLISKGFIFKSSAAVIFLFVFVGFFGNKFSETYKKYLLYN